jgi:hypothetical protein
LDVGFGDRIGNFLMAELRIRPLGITVDKQQIARI